MTMIGEFTEYISPDGLAFRFDDYAKFMISEDGFGMPPISYITQKSPFQHGETLLGFNLGVRVIQMIYREDTCNRFDFWIARNNLLNYMRPNRQYSGQFSPGILRKWLPDGTKRDIYVIIESGPNFAYPTEYWDMWGYTETLRFIAHDPIFFNPDQICVSWILAPNDELSFPISFPISFGGLIINSTLNIVYTGTWMCYPLIKMYGPMSGCTITNSATGQKITFNYTISAGEDVTITLNYGNKTVLNNLGMNLIGSISTDSDLSTFHIAADPEAAGGLNPIIVVASGVDPLITRIDLAYYTRYIGI